MDPAFQAHRDIPRIAHPVRPDGQANRRLGRFKGFTEAVRDDFYPQTAKEPSQLAFFSGRVRIALPGAERAVTLQTQSSLRPHPQQRESNYFRQQLRTNILAASKAFREQPESDPVIVKLPTPFSVTAWRPLGDVPATPIAAPSALTFQGTPFNHLNLEDTPDTPTSPSDHPLSENQMAFPATPQRPSPASSAPPQQVPFPPPGLRPAHQTPPHLRHALNPQAMASSPSLPRGRPSPAGRSRRDPNIAVSDLGWREKYNVKLRFTGFPRTISTLEVWHNFSMQGNIESIELNFDHQGAFDGCGLIRFKPPPTIDFWNRGPYKVRRTNNPQPFTVRLVYLGADEKSIYSGIQNHEAKYPELMEVRAESVEFGVLTAPLEMRTMYKTVPRPGLTTSIVQDLRYRRVEIHFPARIGNDTPQFKLQISHSQSVSVFEVTHPDSSDVTALIVTVETPPLVWRKCGEAQSHTSGEYRWLARDAWWRQTDLSYDPSSSRTLPTSLNKKAAGVNVGRWKTYRILFDLKRQGRADYDRLVSALKDFDIKVEPCSNFLLTGREVTPVWEYIDRQEATITTGPQSSLAQLLDDVIPLAFEVRYQLEVCISEGLLSEYSMPRMFIEELHKLDKQSAVELLEAVASKTDKYFDPMVIFQVVKPIDIRQRIPTYCVYTRSVVVTPTTVYFASPTLEISNRVVRQYRDLADRFLRVRFQDEKSEGKIYGSQREQSNELFTRVKRTMSNGITVGDRHYEFLAFGNSQFREHGAFFFASTQYHSAAKIRRWMGDFKGIRVVAKYAARLGQCFSTTRAIHTVHPRIVETVDITTADGKYTFSDGVGSVSYFLAFMAAKETGNLVYGDRPPSLMQFRLGGAKGVLVIWPHAKQNEIHLRKSQSKFSAVYEGLEVIRWSQFSSAHLNRQLITVLSARGISDDVFIKRLDEEVADLDAAMVNHKKAESKLQDEVDLNGTNLILADMVEKGLHEANEPFMMSILQLWRAFSIKKLKEKAKISIDQGAVLLGCVDESGKLKGYFKSRQPEPTMGNCREALPEVFVQVSRGDGGRPEVKTGLMAVARNPSLYAGDIQVVRGVDLPELRSLVDVVVFPRNGDRDIPSMLSGGDLDGDDFVVIWDEDLIPRMWHEPPAEFSAGKPKDVNHEPTVDEITSFFVQYMRNDSLGIIGTAHLAMADASALGVRDPRCLALAELHSKAVDYNKTGEQAIMPAKLKPPRYPHFMERRHGRIYTSHTVLGKLYDRIDLVDFTPDYAAPFHEGILNAYPVDEDMLAAAKELKGRYDQAVRRIMMQYDIETDFEVWSTYVMRHANFSNDFRFYEKIGDACKAVKSTSLTECFAKAGVKHSPDVKQRDLSNEDVQKLERFAVAMYTVTQREVAEALQQRRETPVYDAEGYPTRGKATRNMPFMSFPWLLAEYLGRIAAANRRHGASQATQTSNIADSQLQAATSELPKLEAVGVNNPGTEAARSKVPMPKSSKTSMPEPRDSSPEDLLFTKRGTVHFGDMLTLFDDDGKNSADSSGPANIPTPASDVSVAPKPPDSRVDVLAAAMGDLSHEEGEGTISPFFNGPLADSPFSDRKAPSPVIGAHQESSSKLRSEPLADPEPAASVDSLFKGTKNVTNGAEEGHGAEEDEKDEEGFEGDDEGEEVELVLPASQKPNPFDKLASLNAE